LLAVQLELSLKLRKSLKADPKVLHAFITTLREFYENFRDIEFQAYRDLFITNDQGVEIVL